MLRYKCSTSSSSTSSSTSTGRHGGYYSNARYISNAKELSESDLTRYPYLKNWQMKENHKKFFDWAATKLNVHKFDDWYNVTLADIIEKGGSGMLEHYGGSHIRALSQVYPEHRWQTWRFRQVPRGYWDDMTNQRKFFDLVAEKKNIKHFDDWQRVKVSDIEEFGGSSLLQRYYGNSLIKALMKVYPEHKWLPFLFTQAPQGYWDDKTNHKVYMDWLATQLDIKEPNDWYKVKRADLLSRKGSRLIEYYGSLLKALQSVYPEHNWVPWMFDKVSPGFWDDIKTHRKYFDWLAGLMNIKKPEDWYQITHVDVVSRGGGRPLAYYNNSLSKALASIYPEFTWQVWKFKAAPKGFWDKSDNVANYLNTLKSQLQITDMNDWYNISQKFFFKLKGETLIRKSGGVIPMLSKFFPEHNWDGTIRTSPSKIQIYLSKLLQSIFPGLDVFVDYRRKDLVYPGTHREMELDIFIPFYSLAFEYQGRQHYSQHFLYGSPEQQQNRDRIKKEVCSKSGITLIEIPFWWDENLSSLLATIKKYRPELVHQSVDALPIPEEMPDAIHKQRIMSQSGSKGAPVDAKWLPLFQKYSYAVAYGTKGTKPKCRGCRIEFTKNTLRIQALVTFHPPNMAPYQGKISFCLNPACIYSAHRSYAKKGQALPSFEGKVGIADDKLAPADLPPVNGIQWMAL